MQLIGGVVGAILGSFVGAPQVGFMVGSMIGGAVDRAMNPIVTEGPRLGDLSISSSAYGNPKPLLYGTARLPAQIIWTDGIKETRVVKKSKGKGGQPTREIRYLYTTNIACGLCQGPVTGFVRIWMDGKLVYNRDGTGVLSNNRFTLRTYLGDETQLPDGLITQKVGESLSPAYRGLAYIVLEDLDLEPFGNRIPNITVEVSNNITNTDYRVSVDFQTNYPYKQINGTKFDRIRGLIVRLHHQTNTSNRTQQVIAVYDEDGREIISRTIDEIFNTPSLSGDYVASYFSDPGIMVIPGEYLYLMTRGSDFKTKLHRLNIYTLEVLETFVSNSILGMRASDISLPSNSIFFPDFSGYQLVYDAIGQLIPYFGISQYPVTGDHVIVRGGENMKIVAGHSRYFNGTNESNTTPGFTPAPFSTINAGLLFVPGKIDFGFSDAYWLNTNEGFGWGTVGGVLNIKKIVLTPYTAFDNISNINVNSFDYGWKSITESQLSTALGTSVNIFVLSACHDPNDDTLLILCSANSSPTYLVKYRYEDNQIIWAREYANNTLPWQRSSIHWSESDLSGGTVGIPGLPGFVVDTATGDVIYNTTAPSAPKHYASIWDSKMYGGYGIYSSTGSVEKFYFNRATTGTVTLKTIVDDLCKRSGLDPLTQIDTTALNSVPVKGYIIARPTTAKAALDQLSSAFFIKSVESDFKLKFFLKTSGSVVDTIPQKWLASNNSDGEGNYWQESRKPELELPRKITVTHINPEDDYQQGAEFQQRITKPFPSSWATSDIVIEMPMVLYKTEAKQLATNLLYSYYAERVSYKSILPWRYAILDPTDTVVVNMDNGEVFSTRITSTIIGSNYHIETDFLSQDTSTFTSPNIASGPSLGFVPQEVISLTKSRIVFLDIPLLKDLDNTIDNMTTVYFAANPYKATWPGGSLDMSFDNGVTYNNLDDFSIPVVAGSVLGMVSNVNDPNIIDETTEIVVYLNNPNDDLESISFDLFLAGENACLIGKEIIYFKNAELQLDGSYKLTYLLRGRRGTEWASNIHTVGEEFVLLSGNDDSIIKKNLDLTTVNNAYYYRLTTFGMYATEGIVNRNIFTGAAERPYSPVNITRSNLLTGISITWDRRNRINGGFVPYVEIPNSDLPLSFDVYILSSAYDPVINKSKAPTTFIRKYTTPTTSVLYTSDDITTDGFDVNSTLHVVIFQKSTRVGDGFPGFSSLSI